MPCFENIPHAAAAETPLELVIAKPQRYDIRRRSRPRSVLGRRSLGLIARWLLFSAAAPPWRIAILRQTHRRRQHSPLPRYILPRLPPHRPRSVLVPDQFMNVDAADALKLAPAMVVKRDVIQPCVFQDRYHALRREDLPARGVVAQPGGIVHRLADEVISVLRVDLR